MNTDFTQHWTLDPAVTFLNHGSFGACPRPVLEAQADLRARMEREPVQFLFREWSARIDAARQTLAEFLGADAAGLAFVPNATSGVNTVLRSLTFDPGDEILVTDHGYPACNNAAQFAAHGVRAELAVARIPFPIESPDQVVEAVLAAVTPKTKLAVLDHVTSPTALVFPIQRLVAELAERGVDTLVDGAHAPGMLPLDISAINAAYYTGNCHKWMCAPKGAAFLHVRADRRDRIRPLVISHGASAKGQPGGDRSFFHIEADWTGTCDPTPWLSIPAAIQFGEDVIDEGWDGWRAHTHALLREARDLVSAALDVAPAAPDSMLGTIASIPLPDASSAAPTTPPMALDPLHLTLFEEHSIEVPVFPWPAPPRRLLRVSAQLYNTRTDYEHLAESLRELG